MKLNSILRMESITRTPGTAPKQDLIDLANGTTVDASRTALFAWGARGHAAAAGGYVNKRVQIWHKSTGMEFTWLFCDALSPTKLYVQFVDSVCARNAVRKYGGSVVDWDPAHSFQSRFAINDKEVLDLLSIFARDPHGRRVYISMGTNALRGLGLVSSSALRDCDDRARVIEYFAELWRANPPSSIELLIPYVSRITGLTPAHAQRVVAPFAKQEPSILHSYGLNAFVNVMLSLIYP